MLLVHEPPSRVKCGFSLLISAIALSAAPGSHFVMRAKTSPWWIGRHAGSMRSLHAGLFDHFQVFGDVDVDHAFGAELADRLAVAAGELVHHDAAVLAVADLRDERRDADAAHVARC